VTTSELREKLLDDMCTLGQRYLDDGNINAALRWLNMAADAAYRLSEIYRDGDGVDAQPVPMSLTTSPYKGVIFFD